MKRALPIAEHIRRVHHQLLRFLHIDSESFALCGGGRFPQVLVAPDPGTQGFDVDYYQERLCLGQGLLSTWEMVRAHWGTCAFEEVARLFFIHEGRHIDQGMAYGSSRITAASVVLEAVDYDADVASVQVCLRYRRYRAQKKMERRGSMGTLADILRHVLVGLRAFEGAQSVEAIKERRLRRHLVWHLQRARAQAADPRLPAERLNLAGRVAAEFVGLSPVMQVHGNKEVQMLSLSGLQGNGDPELVLYVGGRTVRVFERPLLSELLAALCGRGDVDRASRVFFRLFEAHPELVPS